MTGFASAQLRSAFDPETVPGTTNASPTFKTLPQPLMFGGETNRFQPESLIAGGALYGDALLSKPAASKYSAPLIYATYDTFFASLFQSAWSSDALTDGKTRSTVSFENMMKAGDGGTTTYIRHLGNEAVAGSLKADAHGKIDVTFDFVGMESKNTATAALSGATYTDPSNADPFAAGADLGAVTFAGYTLDGIAALSIDYIQKDRTPQPVMGNYVLEGITLGKFQPLIKVKFRLGTNFAAIVDAARVGTQTPAKFTVNFGSVTAKKYRQEFWKCYVVSAPPDFSAPEAFYEMTLQPTWSVSNSGVMTMTRALA